MAMTKLTIDETRFLAKLQGFGILTAPAKEDVKSIFIHSQKLELPFLDYVTIRDLLDLGGYRGDLPLLSVLITLFEVLEEGSLCLDINPERLSEKFSTLMEEKKAEKIANQFLSELKKNNYQRLITKNDDDYLPLILDESKERSLLYFQKYYVYEKGLKDRIVALLDTETSRKGSIKKIEEGIERIFSPELCIRVSKDGDPIVKDPYQLDAIKLALNSRFSIISGGPGTGKTSLMVNILRCLVRNGIRKEDIFLGAPTGRAAQRMTEAVRYNINTIRKPHKKDKELLDLKGGTLHKILRYRSNTHDFYYRDSNPLPASVIIVDEVSMVDVVMMEKFLKAIDPAKTKLILLGDKDQLPSVEAGAVFAEMIPGRTRAKRFKDRLIILENFYRSGKNLMNLAKKINQGECPEITPVSFDAALKLKPDNWAFVKTESAIKWKEHLRLWTKYHYLTPLSDNSMSFYDLIVAAGKMDYEQLTDSDSGRGILKQIFIGIENARILSLIRNGIYGCVGINHQICDHLRSESGYGGNNDIFPGTVIMITRNDYSKDLFNGDIGVVIRDPKGVYRAFFPRFENYQSLAMDLLPPWEHAFAMTVHKSQGSEFDDVLLVLPEDETHKLLTREIVYTGITRAKKRIILYGKESALTTALQRKIKRQSGIMW